MCTRKAANSSGTSPRMMAAFPSTATWWRRWMSPQVLITHMLKFTRSDDKLPCKIISSTHDKKKFKSCFLVIVVVSKGVMCVLFSRPLGAVWPH